MRFIAVLFVILVLIPSIFAEEKTLNVTLNITPFFEEMECDYSVSIETEKSVYQNKEKIAFRNVIDNKPKSFEIEYWIEDEKGDIVKKKTKTKNLNQKSYTPKISEKNKVLIIKNSVTSDCTDEVLTSEKIILVKNDDFEPEDAHHEEITKTQNIKKTVAEKENNHKNEPDELKETTNKKSQKNKVQYFLAAAFAVLLGILIFKKDIFDKFI